jgi:WD40 repeat protein
MKEDSANPNAGAAETIFNAALAFCAAERPAYLAGACGDNVPLRQRVEALLRAHDAPQGFLPEQPGAAPKSTIVVTPISEAAGTVIGRYKLLQQIGEGGCGVVYMAEQQEPVRRRVALKVIKLGMDTKQVIARFEAERQALALMDHPNIAKVFDAGATETGRPYFVMELVRGIPITRYCDEKNLSTVTRLGLFVQVCQAIQHAHQKGIIHRDIKPSNILVAEHDGVPVPKIIDFGIAKATTDQRLTDKTMFTAFEQFIGTPAYMSPEQANLSGLDIDTRSDIYSLGVLLYELLTGKTPFEAKWLLEVGLDEIRRIIREEEPVRPSTKLHTLDAAEQTTVARHRQSDPPKLARLISGDLDWIVMKALEKDRGRRYETANGLAKDIQRHLNNEPVAACPPSNLYRFQKMARRNKLVFAAAGAVALALLAGLGLSTWAFLRERQAHANELTARRTADEQRQRAEASARTTQTREAEARRLLYAANMNLAQNAWEQNRLGRLQESLDDTQTFPDRGFEWYYWQRQTHLAVLTLREINPVVSVAYSPDGKRIVTGTGFRALVWDAASGKALLTLAGPAWTGTGELLGPVAFSPDGQRIVTGSNDGTAKVWEAKVWDATSGKELANLKGHTEFIRSVAFSPDGQRIVTGSSDGTARVWDTASGKVLLTLNARTALAADALAAQMQWLGGKSVRVDSAAFSPDGQRIITVAGGQANVWDAASGQELLSLSTLKTSTSAIGSAAFSKDGQRIVTGNGKTANVWDAATGGEVFTLAGHADFVSCVAFSPDGQRIVTGSLDGTIKLWDAAFGMELLSLKGHEYGVFSVAFSPDGRRIVTGGGDKAAKVWEIASAKSLRAALEEYKKDPRYACSIVFSPDGKRIVTEMGGKGQVWEATSGRELLSLKEDRSSTVTSVAISSNGERIVAWDLRTVNVWDAASGRELVTLKWKTNSVSSVALYPDGQRIVTLGLDGAARVWDAASGRELFTLDGHSGGITSWVTSVIFSPDGQRIVTGGGRQPQVWDAASGRELPTLIKEQNVALFPEAFSPDGRIVTVSPGRGGRKVGPTIRECEPVANAWDAASGKKLLTLKLPTGVPWGLFAAISPDGRRIVTGGSDQTAQVWDAASGRELLTLKGHSAFVTCAAFSTDGQRIVTGSVDTTVKLWDALSGRELLTLTGFNADLGHVAFSPDGHWIVAGKSMSGQPDKLWEAARPEQVAQWHAEEAAAVQH